MSDEDYIALLIGRVIMGWGRIDYLLDAEIIRFELQKQPEILPHELKIKNSFEGRVRYWGQLCASICQSDQPKLSAVDCVSTKMKEDVLIRHHLAHGYVVLLKLGRRGTRTERPNLHIFLHKELTKRVGESEEAFKRDPTIKFWAEDLHPMYTIEELEAHIENIAKLREEFESASFAIFPRSVFSR